MVTLLTQRKNLCLLKQQEAIHTNVQTEKHKKLALGGGEHSEQVLPVHSHWMALNLRQLPIFQADKSCVFQQDST